VLLCGGYNLSLLQWVVDFSITNCIKIYIYLILKYKSSSIHINPNYNILDEVQAFKT